MFYMIVLISVTIHLSNTSDHVLIVLNQLWGIWYLFWLEGGLFSVTYRVSLTFDIHMKTRCSTTKCLIKLKSNPVSPGCRGCPGCPGWQLPGWHSQADLPVSPGIPGGPGAPCCPGAPGVPVCPSIPASPVWPTAPGNPVWPGSPIWPFTPGWPVWPGGPRTPGKPGWPFSPSLPGFPGRPTIHCPSPPSVIPELP